MELWKDIQGFEGLYQVSNMGNVRSCSWKNMGFPKNLFLKKHNKGYRHVELVNKGTKKAFLVHRLVAEAFIPNPNGYPFINHIDEDKTNNRVENLEWCTQRQNMRAYFNNHPEFTWENGGGVYGRHRHKKSKYGDTNRNVRQLNMDGSFVKLWESAAEIAYENKWKQSSIAECCRGKRQKAYGYKWEYADENLLSI